MKPFSGTDNWHAAATAKLHIWWSKEISKASFEGRRNIICKIGLMAAGGNTVASS